MDIPAKGELVSIAQAEGGSLLYRVTDVQESGTGIWTYDLEPVAEDDRASAHQAPSRSDVSTWPSSIH